MTDPEDDWEDTAKVTVKEEVEEEEEGEVNEEVSSAMELGHVNPRVGSRGGMWRGSMSPLSTVIPPGSPMSELHFYSSDTFLTTTHLIC